MRGGPKSFFLGFARHRHKTHRRDGATLKLSVLLLQKVKILITDGTTGKIYPSALIATV